MSDRGDAPDAVLEELWPAMAPSSSTGSTGVRFLALPRAAAATVLVPRTPASAAAAVLRAHRAPVGARARSRHFLVVAAARAGAVRLLARGDRLLDLTGRDLSVLEDVSSVVDVPTVVGVHLGPPRANRKPILQLVDAQGTTVAFAKVGTNDLTRRLVRAEAEALQLLAETPVRHLLVPQVLSSRRSGSHEVLVLAPFDPTSRPDDGSARIHAMVELSRVGGVTVQPLVATPLWLDLRERLGRLDGPAATVLRECADALGSAARATDVAVGSWHGDWTPWNMAVRPDAALVWDWERFQNGVPLGWDALHYDVQTAIRRGGLEPRAAVSATVRSADALLSPFGVAASSVTVTTAAYLLEIAARYLADDQEGAGSRLGRVGEWLLPELRALSHRIGADSPR